MLSHRIVITGLPSKHTSIFNVDNGWTIESQNVFDEFADVWPNKRLAFLFKRILLDLYKQNASIKHNK